MLAISGRKVKSSPRVKEGSQGGGQRERERERECGDSRKAPLEGPLALSPEVDDSRTCESQFQGN